MPGESGWTVCDSIRQELGADCRIVMVSANAHEFRRGRDGEASHDLFLKKPVELDAILDAVSDLLSLRWTAVSSAERASPAALAAVGPLPAGAGELIEEIERRALIGHVRGIEAAVRELESRFPEATPHAAQLLEHLDRFDIPVLLKTVRAFK